MRYISDKGVLLLWAISNPFAESKTMRVMNVYFIVNGLKCLVITKINDYDFHLKRLMF